MREYTPQKYIELVTNSSIDYLRDFMNDEKDFLLKICGGKELVDLGAGYGRIIPFVIPLIDFYYGIDINDSMFLELKNRTNSYNNAKAIKGDFTKLQNIISSEKINTDNSIFVLLQNTLGTIEGSLLNLLEELKALFLNEQVDLIISLFKSEKLEESGIMMFKSLADMVGEPDIDKCDFTEGIFRTKSGYEAKWWSEEEIENIFSYLGASVISSSEKEIYAIYHLRKKP